MLIQQNSQDYNSLKMAVALLESPSIITSISNVIGSPIEGAVKRLPALVSKRINTAVEAALRKAVDVALWSLGNEPNKLASTRLHKFYAATSGAIGGAFGFTSLFIELPISTTIMMRSVADIARSEGFDLNSVEVKCACIEVFALGGKAKKNDATETGYYISRSFMTESMRQLSKELAKISAGQGAKGIGSVTPAQVGKLLASVIEKVAARFGIVITNKFAAQAIPVIGAVTGATINTLFTDFYQNMARGHFIIKRLKATYGEEQIKAEYEKLAKGS